jgi:hypothetical protein
VGDILKAKELGFRIPIEFLENLKKALRKA